MAKRHQSLVLLSRDHHHGLALALRLQQGDKALLNDGWTHDRVEQAKHVRDYYAQELMPHFEVEEKVLFPAMRKHIHTSSDFLDSLIHQHRELMKFVDRLGEIEGAILNEQLIRIGDLLDQHIRAEERELFPLFETQIPNALAVDVGESIARFYRERHFPK